MKILVTGGNGELGRALLPYLLEQGHEVVSLDRALPPESPARWPAPAPLQGRRYDRLRPGGGLPARLPGRHPPGRPPLADERPRAAWSTSKTRPPATTSCAPRPRWASSACAWPRPSTPSAACSAAGRATITSRWTSSTPAYRRGPLQPVEMGARAAGRRLCPALRDDEHRQPALPLAGGQPRARRRASAGAFPIAPSATCGPTRCWARPPAPACWRSPPISPATRPFTSPRRAPPWTSPRPRWRSSTFPRPPSAAICPARPVSSIAPGPSNCSAGAMRRANASG